MTGKNDITEIVQQLRDFPQFLSTDKGIHWYRTQDKDPLTTKAAHLIEQLNDAAWEVVEVHKMLKDLVRLLEDKTKTMNLIVEAAALIAEKYDHYCANEIRALNPIIRQAMRDSNKGFTCECGKEHAFGLYVAAHWNERMEHTCECGRHHEVFRGYVKLLQSGKKKAKHG